MKLNFFQNLFGKSKQDAPKIGDSETETDTPTTDIKTLLERAKKKFDKGNYQSALVDVNKVIEIDPTDFSAYFERSKIKRNLNDAIGADEDSETGMLFVKKKERGLKALDKAREKYDANDFKEAIKYYNEAISFTIQFPEVYYDRAMSKKYFGDYEGALQDFNKAIELDPDFEDGYYDRARLKHHQLKDYKGSLQDYDKAIQLNPNDAKLFDHRGTLKDEMNDKTGAKDDFIKAITINPKRGETYFSLASIKFKLRDFPGGIKDLDMAIQAGFVGDSSFTLYHAYYFRGSYKSLLKDYEEAIKDFDKAIELEPDKGEVFFARGEARLALGETYLAAEDKFMALKLGYEDED